MGRLAGLLEKPPEEIKGGRLARFAHREEPEVIDESPEILTARQQLLEKVYFGQAGDIATQSEIARELSAFTDDPAKGITRTENRWMLSTLFDVPLDDVEFLESGMVKQLYGKPIKEISDLVINKSLKEDLAGALKESPENLWIGTIGLTAGVLEGIKLDAIQLAGGGALPDDAVRHQFEAITPDPVPGVDSLRDPADANNYIYREDAFDFLRPQRPLPGAIVAEAFGILTRLPDIGAKILRKKQGKLAETQSIALMSNAPITKLMRVTVQSGVPSMGAAVGISLLTGNPLVGLVMLGQSEGGAAFQRQLETGGSVQKAIIIGRLSEAAEIGGEMLVLPGIIKGFKEGLSIRRGLTLIAENAGQEGITGFNQVFLEVFGIETTKGTDISLAAKMAFVAGVEAVPENAFVGGATAGAASGVGVGIDVVRGLASPVQARKAIDDIINQVKTDIATEEAAITDEAQAEAEAAEAVERQAKPVVDKAEEVEDLETLTEGVPDFQVRADLASELRSLSKKKLDERAAEFGIKPGQQLDVHKIFKKDKKSSTIDFIVSASAAEKTAKEMAVTAKGKVFFRGDVEGRTTGLINLTESKDAAASFVLGGTFETEEEFEAAFESGQIAEAEARVKSFSAKVNKTLVIDKDGLTIIARLEDRGNREAKKIIDGAEVRLLQKGDTFQWWTNTQPHTQVAWEKVLIPQLQELGFDSIEYQDQTLVGLDRTLAVFNISQLQAPELAEKPEAEPTGPSTEDIISKVTGREAVKPEEKRVISKEAFDAALKRFTDKSKLRVGLDPQMIKDATIMGGYLLETGIRKTAKGVVNIADWSVEMIKFMGETIKPHLQSIWDSIQPGDKLAKEDLRRKIKRARTDKSKVELQRRLDALEAGEVAPRVKKVEVATVPGTEIEFDSVGAFGGNTVTFFRDGKTVHTITTRNITEARQMASDFQTILKVKPEARGAAAAAQEFLRREAGKRIPVAGLTAEATVKAELKKDAAVIKEALAIDKTKDAEKIKQAAKKLRDRISELVAVKGMTNRALTDLTREHTKFTKLRGKLIEERTTITELVNLLEAIEKARPEVVGHRRVLSQKIEDQIAEFKESLIDAGRLTESEFNRILDLVVSKGFGQVGPGKPRQAKFISAESFITQEEARDLLDRMHDSAEVLGVTEPLARAVEADPEIKAEMQNVKSQPSSIGDPSAPTITNRIRNAVFGTTFFDRLYSMRFYSQRLGDRAASPIYKLYNSLKRTGQQLTRERAKVFKFLQTLPDFDKIAADNEALQRVSDAIASKSTLENRPDFPEAITESELRLVKEIEKIFKVYEFHAKVGKFFQHKDDLTRMPQYLAFQDSIDRALEIYDTKGVDALFDYIKTQNWGVVKAGYEPMRSVIRKISTHQMPDVAVGKGHIKVRGIEYAKQDRNILMRLQSYMRQMDTLAFMQPKIKAWVRLIDDNIQNFEDQENIRQVISTYLNNLKKTNAEDGIVEEIMMRVYSQAITTRVLADPLKVPRNLLQNVALGEDRTDLFDPRNKTLTEADQEYLETFVQQDKVMMSDWAFAGLDPLNLPLIGTQRLGIDKVTKWTQRHTMYPASDRKNRTWSFWARINRVRRAFTRDQTLAEKMLESRFSDMQRSEQVLALEILASEGVDPMARFIAQVHTDNTHFLYAREERSPAEQTRVGKLVLNLALFKRAAVEKAVLQMQKATASGSLRNRVRAAKNLALLLVMASITNWIWKELTGKKFGAYDFINFLEVNAGGLELAAVQKVETVHNLMIRAVAKGDTKALAALPSAIATSADYFIPYYDLGTRAIEAMFDEKNLDIQAMNEIRAMIDKEYKKRKKSRIDRSLLEKFQFTFGGPGVDRKESQVRKKSETSIFD